MLCIQGAAKKVTQQFSIILPIFTELTYCSSKLHKSKVFKFDFRNSTAKARLNKLLMLMFEDVANVATNSNSYCLQNTCSM